MMDITTEQVLERYKIACEFKQSRDKVAIEKALVAWINEIDPAINITVKFPETESEIGAARDAWAAWAARTAWDAWDVDWVATTAIGAVELKDQRNYQIWIHLLEALEAGAWFFWFTGDNSIAVICIPKQTLTDSQNRLHCENGPAMVWLDAKLYYWHGVEVPASVIVAPETITASAINAETNVEVRRVMLERIGYERYLREANAVTVYEDRDRGGVRKLLRMDQPNDEPLVCLWVVCPSTGHNYTLRVPPTMTTCHQAAAWIAGFSDPDDYHPMYES